MPITVTCDCGKSLRVADAHAGKKAKCPVCEALVPIPKAEPEFEVVEDDPPAKPAPKKAAVVVDDDDEPKPKKKKALAVADEDDDPKPKKKKKRPRDDDDDDDRPRRRARARNDSDAGKKALYIVGGLLLIAGGIALAVYGYNHEGRGSVRAMVFGGFLALGGFGTTVQGATGNFDDDE